MEKNFACDIETGVCAPKKATGIEEIEMETTEKVRMMYYTDPICSACWAIEPQLKRFKLEYGDWVEIEYKMGGLLPGWEGFSDSGNGISKPSDVAHHWDEVGEHTGMSIDGDVWLEDPLDSSFPPSIAFKAAQQQGEAFALRFLRRIREQVFLEKKNITKEIHLIEAIEDCGGDSQQFLKAYRDEKTKASFYQEMQEGRNYGVRGFPTFIFITKSGKGLKMSGMSDYTNYVKALEQALGERPEPKSVQYTILDLLKKYPLLATKEIAFVLQQEEASVLAQLQQMVKSDTVIQKKHKFGDYWELK